MKDLSFSKAWQKFTKDDEVERCGLILGGKSICCLYEVENVHETPEDSFRITGGQVRIALARTGLELRGFFHTHWGPGDRGPSPRDLKGVRHPELLYCVYHPYTRLLTWYNQNGITEIESVRYRIRGRVHIG